VIRWAWTMGRFEIFQAMLPTPWRWRRPETAGPIDQPRWGALGGVVVHSGLASKGCRGRNRNTRTAKAPGVGAGAAGKRRMTLAGPGLTSSPALHSARLSRGDAESPQKGFCCALDSGSLQLPREPVEERPVHRLRPPFANERSWAATAQGRFGAAPG